MPYYLHVEFERGTDELRLCGLLSAARVFESRNVTASQAAIASFAREGWHEGGFDPQHEPTAEQFLAADAWDEAISAARMACDATSADVHLALVRAESLPAYYPRTLDATLRRATDLSRA